MIELRQELWTCVESNDRWETVVTVVLGLSGIAAIAWATQGLLGTQLP